MHGQKKKRIVGLHSDVTPNPLSCYICLFFFFQTTTIAHGRCTNGFEGTSAATPLAAGVIALMLEAKYTQLLNLPHFQAFPNFFLFLFVCFLLLFFRLYTKHKLKSKKNGGGLETRLLLDSFSTQLIHACVF